MIRLLPIGGVRPSTPAASEAVIDQLTLIVLVVRPRGLFGEEGLFE
jgi:hypothetical protein